MTTEEFSFQPVPAQSELPCPMWMFCDSVQQGNSTVCPGELTQLPGTPTPPALLCWSSKAGPLPLTAHLLPYLLPLPEPRST